MGTRVKTNSNQRTMNGDDRRAALIGILQGSSIPVSGTSLAKQLGVSRQVIVQDVALLKAKDVLLYSTPKGYILASSEPNVYKRRFWVSHSAEQIEEELNLIVDLGAAVLDVIVKHPVYGEITGPLNISSRRDVRQFLERIQREKGAPLLSMSNGTHYHTVEADSPEILEEVETALRSAGILQEEHS